MEIKREQGFENTYDYEFIEDNKTLEIKYAANLDLYMLLGDKTFIPDDKPYSIDFDITKGNYEIFRIFDTLYNEVITGDALGPYEENEFNLEDEEPREHSYFDDTYAYRLLVDENGVITWVSDEGQMEIEDSMKLYRLDEDTYRLTFIRNDKEYQFGFKSACHICIRICNSGSRYQPFNCAFMRMYQKIQKIDPMAHQIDLEEVLYVKKLKSN